MFGSKILDVAIGLIFVYIIVSILCTAVREGIEAWLKTRAAYLEHGIRLLLQDPDGTGIAKQLFGHPLIDGLFIGKYQALSKTTASRPTLGGDLPSYIPSKSFARALLDLAARGPVDGSSDKYGKPISLDVIRRNVSANIPNNSKIQRIVLQAVDSAQGDLDKAQKAIEDWYDSAMDRVSGWYKRSTQQILLALGLLIAVGMNIDSVAIVDRLYHSDAVRETVVAAASKAADNYNASKKSGNSTTPKDKTDNPYQQATAALKDLRLPVGWDNAKPSFSPPADGDYLRHFVFPWIGWILTAIAATLGAPFWFDILNKIMVIRSTVKPHEKSPEEGSEDRQKPAPAPTNVNAGGSPPTPSPANDVVDGCEMLQTTGLDFTDDSQLPLPQGGAA